MFEALRMRERMVAKAVAEGRTWHSYNCPSAPGLLNASSRWLQLKLHGARVCRKLPPTERINGKMQHRTQQRSSPVIATQFPRTTHDRVFSGPPT